MTTRCHSVRSLRSPDILSFQLSEVATDRLQTLPPLCMERTSGSLPRLPMRMTLLTLPATGTPVRWNDRLKRLGAQAGWRNAVIARYRIGRDNLRLRGKRGNGHGKQRIKAERRTTAGVGRNQPAVRGAQA